MFLRARGERKSVFRDLGYSSNFQAHANITNATNRGLSCENGSGCISGFSVVLGFSFFGGFLSSFTKLIGATGSFLLGFYQVFSFILLLTNFFMSGRVAKTTPLEG